MANKGDRVLLHAFALYRGETIPDIPESEFTGEVLGCWGKYQSFYKVRRDYDGRIIPVMEQDIKSVVERHRERR